MAVRVLLVDGTDVRHDLGYRFVLTGSLLEVVDIKGDSIGVHAPETWSWASVEADSAGQIEQPSIDPLWRTGDVVVDPRGRTYAFTSLPKYPWLWLNPAPDAATYYADTEIKRPLTLLVRDGKPVTGG